MPEREILAAMRGHGLMGYAYGGRWGSVSCSVHTLDAPVEPSTHDPCGPALGPQFMNPSRERGAAVWDGIHLGTSFRWITGWPWEG